MSVACFCLPWSKFREEEHSTDGGLQGHVTDILVLLGDGGEDEPHLVLSHLLQDGLMFHLDNRSLVIDLHHNIGPGQSGPEDRGQQ